MLYLLCFIYIFSFRRKRCLKYLNTQLNTSCRQVKYRQKQGQMNNDGVTHICAHTHPPTHTHTHTHLHTHITFLSVYTGDLIIGSDLTGDRLFILLTSLHFHINTRECFLLKRKEPIFKHRGKKHLLKNTSLCSMCSSQTGYSVEKRKVSFL